MPPWVSDAVLVALVTGVIGLVAGRATRRDQAKADAEQAAAEAAAQERRALIAPYEALAARVEQLETEASDQRVEADALRSQVTELRIEVANLRADKEQLAARSDARDSLWQAGWDDIRAHWPQWRAREEPPPYPTPKREEKAP